MRVRLPAEARTTFPLQFFSGRSIAGRAEGDGHLLAPACEQRGGGSIGVSWQAALRRSDTVSLSCAA